MTTDPNSSQSWLPHEVSAAALCQAGIGVVAFNGEGVIVHCNGAFAEMLGYLPEELAGQEIGGLVHPLDRGAGSDAITALQAGSRSKCSLDRRLLHKSGRPVWVRERMSFVREPRPLTIAIVDHLDPQREMSIALRASEERYRSMVESTEQVFFYEQDEQKRFIYLSPSVRSVLGYDPMDLIGRPIDEVITGHADLDAGTHLERELRGRKHDLGTVCATHKRGHTVYMEIVFSRVHGEDGRLHKQGMARDVTARKHVEDSLLLSHQILQTIDSLVLVADERGLIVFASPSVAHLLKCRQSELMGYGWWTMSHAAPEERMRHCEHAGQLARGEARPRSQPLEQEITDRAGIRHRILWQERQASKSLAIYCGTDITNHKQAEQALRTRTSQLDALIEHCPIGILIADSEGRIQMCNRLFEEIFGYSQYELIGKRASMLVPLDIRDEQVKLEQRLMEGDAASLLTRRVRKDGRVIDVELRAVPLVPMREDGPAPGMYMLFSDITVRVQAERALQQSEQHLRAIFDCSLDGMFLVNGEGHYIDANPAGCRLLARPREEILNGRIGSFSEGTDPLRFWSELSAQGWAQHEIMVRRPDGELRMVGFSLTPDILPGLNLVIAHDMTEKRELEQKLLQSQKMEAIGRLAGGVAHDINNMLTVIRGYSELMVKKLPKAHPLARYAHSIVSASDRSSMITQQLLAFSRRQIVMPQTIAANRVISEILKLIQRLIGEDIQLTVDLSQDAGMVLIDPGQLGQVLMNLAVNARDAMPNGGRLNISTGSVLLDGKVDGHMPQKPGEYVVIAVSDTGCGMAGDVVTHIFEPFFSTKELGKGTGLGLATVYGVVKQGGGGLAVESEVNAGATFRVYLPRVDDEPMQEKPHEMAQMPSGADEGVAAPATN
jgi:two-component system cell cycle sensor histidine kinase/response regulator CckA